MPATPFVLFGSAHLVTMLVVLAVVLCLPLAVRLYADAVWQQRIGLIIALLLLMQELFETWLKFAVFDLPVKALLPLHLCGLAVYLTIWILVRRAYGVYEVVYFWALAGTTQAILTPDLQQGFPHPAYLAFFLSHTLVILGILYATLVYRFRPRLVSIAKSIGALAVVALTIFPINLWLGTNYLYLIAKPERSSLMDFLGPWPWYILSLGGIALLSCLLWYLPFVIGDIWSRCAEKRAGR